MWTVSPSGEPRLQSHDAPVAIGIDKLRGNVCAVFPSQGALVDTLLAISVLGVLKTDGAYHVFYGFAKQLGGFLTAGGADVVLVPGQCVDVQRGALLIMRARRIGDLLHTMEQHFLRIFSRFLYESENFFIKYYELPKR